MRRSAGGGGTGRGLAGPPDPWQEQRPPPRPRDLSGDKQRIGHRRSITRQRASSTPLHRHTTGQSLRASGSTLSLGNWVDIANDLLRRCRINHQIKQLSECGADVFIRLYESILGEKVPDFIATPRSQEDDAHNIQAVIDSLALDYLQVSLSHITGENIVKGERESIRNLLEIFDGLLEYLTEEDSEASLQNGDDTNFLFNNKIPNAPPECMENNIGELMPSSELSSVKGSQSETFMPPCDVDGSGSTHELIRLGEPAQSFLEKEEGSMESAHTTEFHEKNLSSGARKLGEPIRQAIPLLPPFQPSETRPLYPAGRDCQSSDSQSATLVNSQGLETPTCETSLAQKSESLAGSVPLSRKMPVGEEHGPEDSVAKVPLVDGTSTSTSLLHEELSAGTEQVTQAAGPESRYLARKKRSENSSTDSFEEESVSHIKTKEELSEQELHEISEKLSRRLNELDLMLKRALGEHAREELADEDNLSQHSDSVMDYRRSKARLDTPHIKKYPNRPRSLSPSSPQSQHQLSSELQDKLYRDERGQIGKIRSQLQKEMDERRVKAKLVSKAYEDELRIYEARERLRLSKLREKAKEMEQEYKENIFKEPPKMPQPVKVYSRKTTPRNPKHSQWIPKRGTVKPKKAAPMKVKDDDLLFLLLEEFPHLHISHHTMKKMCQQQLAQIEQLKAASGKDRAKLKLQNEVQQALRKHELLADIIKKDQDHNKRLQEFKQRIYRQKRAQNNVREKRQQIARARKYYEDYRVQLRAKMMRARTREERIFKNLFEEGLEIQKQRLKDLRTYAQEKRAEQRREHQNELESMENYYKDQFSMLAEALSQERQEIQTREKAQAQMLRKTKRDLRSKMEKEIQQLQTMIMQNDEDTFFQELEADRLRSRLQMASFQYSKSSFF
ncbi:PREDICTED: centrosomal protein of 95 kDa [Tinamus guttatus]|uniref:centrosomal protein of 95 kDa n=1 Tax=Tinamus guttatus TaxID=94827 RepID=UPI00052E915D|nr:PREDICTED: centrosomal protein of 95 kDa [Tinamus guttatus]